MRTNTLRYVILKDLAKNRGTTREIAERTGIKHSTVSNALSFMNADGYVYPYGTSIEGNPCYIWDATEFGLMTLEVLDHETR